MIQLINEYLVAIGPEREHFLREVLQEQLGRHWLSIYFPEKLVVLDKIRGDQNSEVA
jgi:hypothetical protein